MIFSLPSNVEKYETCQGIKRGVPTSLLFVEALVPRLLQRTNPDRGKLLRIEESTYVTLSKDITFSKKVIPPPTRGFYLL